MEDKGLVQKRRGSDLVTLTSWDLLRRHIAIGGWFGNGLFLVYGILYGLAYGTVGGVMFFNDMYLIDELGSLQTVIGVIFGTMIGLICVWAICVILGAFIGALVYWFKYRSFPMPSR